MSQQNPISRTVAFPPLFCGGGEERGDIKDSFFFFINKNIILLILLYLNLISIFVKKIENLCPADEK